MVDTDYVQSKASTFLNCTTQFVLFKAIIKKRKPKKKNVKEVSLAALKKSLHLKVA